VIPLPDTQQLISEGNAAAISPDGKNIVYAAEQDGAQQLYFRPMDQFEAIPIPGTEGAASPFFSPDGEWVGFWSGDLLKKTPIDGGPSFTLCEKAGRYASWAQDDTILFTAVSSPMTIFRVSASGGTPQAVTTLNTEKGDNIHFAPKLLPDGKTMLFGVFDRAGAHIALKDLETNERKILMSDSLFAHYLPTGHLVFTRGTSWPTTLLAVRFNLENLEIMGEPIPLLEGIGRPAFGISSEGTLLFVPGGDLPRYSLVWVDRHGNEETLLQNPGLLLNPRISPDGQRLSYAKESEPLYDVCIYDIRRGTESKLVLGGAFRPIWTPDGTRVTFASKNEDDQWMLTWKSADGSGPSEPFTEGTSNIPILTSWSPDGAVLAYMILDPVNGRDIWMLPTEEGREPYPFLQSPHGEAHAMFSPDGRFVAFTSNESGRDEIYVQPFPGSGGKWSVSTDGGAQPVWAKDGRELYYRHDNQLLAVTIETDPAIVVGQPSVLFEGNYHWGAAAGAGTDLTSNYDVSPDGERF
jgi:serine/threonine-protein kinase